jgi:hypothetical protein
MPLSDKPSLVLPRFACVIQQTSGKKSSVTVSEYEFDIPKAAEDTEFLETHLKKFTSFYVLCPPSFTTPAVSVDGVWKWDLANRLQVLTQERDKVAKTPIYVRIGFVPKKKDRLAVTVVESPPKAVE